MSGGNENPGSIGAPHPLSCTGESRLTRKVFLNPLKASDQCLIKHEETHAEAAQDLNPLLSI